MTLLQSVQVQSSRFAFQRVNTQKKRNKFPVWFPKLIATHPYSFDMLADGE